jgi:hypothetical protein
VGPHRVGDAEYLLIHADIERGESDKGTAERAQRRGTQITFGSVNRHRKRHLRPAEIVTERSDFADLSEIEALTEAIRQGQTMIPGWKMTPGEWMKALELKMRLTEGTVFDAFLGAVASASQEVADDDSPGVDVRPEGLVGAPDAS